VGFAAGAEADLALAAPSLFGQQRAGRHGFALLGDNFGEDARRGRIDFERNLIGLQLGQRFIRPHRVAGLLEPTADCRLGYGFT